MFQFPMKCFEIAEFHVTNCPYHVTLLLLIKPAKVQAGCQKAERTGCRLPGLALAETPGEGNGIPFLRQVRTLTPARTLQTALSFYGPAVMVPK